MRLTLKRNCLIFAAKRKKPLSNDDSEVADFGFVRLSVICFRNSAHADEPVERNQLICRCVVLWRLYIGSVDADYYRAVIDVVFGPKIFGKLILSSQEEKQSSQEKLQTMLSSLFNAKDYLRINDRKSFGVDLFKRSYQEFWKISTKTA